MLIYNFLLGISQIKQQYLIFITSYILWVFSHYLFFWILIAFATFLFSRNIYPTKKP